MTGDIAPSTRASGSPSTATTARRQDVVVDLISRAPEAVYITQRDDRIRCACHSGDKRHAQDMLKIRQSENFVWVHMPCQPFLAEMSEASASRFETVLYRTQAASENKDDMHVLTEKMLATSLDPDPTEEQLKKVRNITSKFHCDGPCRGSTNHRAYFWCHLCCAWQHRPCMLFGDTGDKGRPICNPCYIAIMIDGEAHTVWQRERLAQAAHEALDFIRNKDNHRQTERVLYAVKFLGKLLHKNRGTYKKFVINRRRVVRWIKARKGLPQPDYLRNAVALPADTLVNAVANAHVAVPPRRPRKRSTIKSGTPSLATDDGLENSTLANGNEESSDESTIQVGKVVAQPPPTRTRPVTTRRPKRNTVPAAPLIVESDSEDDAQNERMRRAASLKARKAAAMAGGWSTKAVTVIEDPAPILKANMKTHVSRPERAEDDVLQSFADIGIPPAQGSQDLAKSSNNLFRAARKSAPSSGQLTRHKDNDRNAYNGNDKSSMPMLPPRNKGKQRRVTFAEVVEEEDTRSPGRLRKTRDTVPDIRCSCFGTASLADCFQCGDCHAWQHKACVSRDSRAQSRCKLCLGSNAAAISPPRSTILPTIEPRTDGPEESTFSASNHTMPDAPVRFQSMVSTAPSSSTIATSAPPSLQGSAMIQPVPAEMAPLSEVLYSQVRSALTQSAPHGTAPPPAALARPVPSSSEPASVAIQVGATGSRPSTIASPAQQREPLEEFMKQEVRALCSTTLWDAYCDLPDPNGWIDGRNTAKTPPPADWGTEAEYRLTLMFEVCGKEKVDEYMRPEFQQFPRNSVNMMKALRDFGSWARIKGPFRRTRKELGLLEEILGFADKGKYWPIKQKPKTEGT